jgi:hypothetical protein
MKLLKSLSYSLIFLLVLSIGFLRIFDLQADLEHSLFLFLIFTIFIVISSLTISVISAISFIHTGNRAVLWMGLGAMVFGLGAGISTGLYEFDVIGINGLVTIYNVLPFLSSWCFFLSAFLFYHSIEKI